MKVDGEGEGDLGLDERTRRLGREWFAEVREKNRKAAEPGKARRQDASGKGEVSFLDWFSGGDSDGGGGDGGD